MKRVLFFVVAGGGVIALLVVGAMLFSRDESLDLRRVAIVSQFSATSRATVFPVLLSGETMALAFYDRRSRQQFLIAEDSWRFSRPYLSPDGERLMFVRGRSNNRTNEIVSCEIDGWTCRRVLSVDKELTSPVEVAPDKIVYASSPYAANPDGSARAGEYDFYLLMFGSQPKRLTNFTAGALGATSVVGTRLLFQAFPHSSSKAFARGGPSDSEIYEMTFDPAREEIVPPAEKLEPIRPVAGSLSSPALSPDGKFMTFLQRRNSKGEFHFDLIITSSDGVVRTVQTPGPSFSRAAFVGEMVVANELANDRYWIRAFNPKTGTSEPIHELDASPRTLNKLKRIELALEP